MSEPYILSRFKYIGLISKWDALIGIKDDNEGYIYDNIKEGLVSLEEYKRLEF